MTPAGGRRARPPGGIGAAVNLTWRAAPGATAASLGLAVVAALVPVGTAWLTKLVLDTLVAGDAAPGTVVVLAVALAGAGLAGLGLVQAKRMVDLALGRRVRLLATDRLYAAVGRFVGLSALSRTRPSATG